MNTVWISKKEKKLEAGEKLYLERFFLTNGFKSKPIIE